MTPPDRAPTTLAVLRRVAEDTPRALQEIVPQIPDWLVVIINKLLAKCHVELQSKGAVTCVAGTYLALHDEPQSSHHAPRDEPSAAATSSKNRPQPGQALPQSAAVLPSAAPEGSSRRSETAPLKRTLLLVGGIIANAAIPVAWTFMSEILAKHCRMIEWLPRHKNPRFDRVSWSSDEHGCPSCVRLVLDFQNVRAVMAAKERRDHKGRWMPRRH